MHYPQSNELESRLSDYGQIKKKTDILDHHHHQGNDDHKNYGEEEKTGKRTTYSDRLLVYRTELERNKENPSSDTESDKNNLITEISSSISRTSSYPAASQKNDEIKLKLTRSAELKELVTQAIKDHKIFCIFDNHWYIVRPVREELLNRGWLEVIPDRRLVPRRRPPPLGTIEAILTAKETFIEELQELSKSSSFQASLDKPKLQMIPSVPSKKTSDESLKEALSLFRISPPGYDKKKNNYEIREFVSKCQSINKETDKREKTIKKLKEKVTESSKKN
ncbi:hypothetical protein Phum_PHUM410730 [Pediculus humanus corporis]|uniref:Uncharacterized protein n=1 Tax=Pediculus humanus subsp. corporis TaxID=121224 RepID=E0VS31_PEDHC|nr:uncharacterized protein Phum_PHUM410730 [Pediculus humanus corporis]EEB16187.1 hypothetical protein Phum_PHUM410730 [Pediculus humanus corporis]